MSIQNDIESSRMPLWEHLDELRNRLFRIFAVLFLGVFVTYYFSDSIVLYLEQPLLKILPKDQAKLYFTGIADKFFVYFQVSLLSAFLVVLPYIFWEVWGFISPGLYQKERRFFLPFISLASLSFITGAAFGFYIVIPQGYRFLLEFGNPSDQAIITLTEYFSLTLKLLFAMGVIFELPVFLILMAKLGIVDSQFLKKNRTYAFVACAVVSAIVTPTTDAFTMCLVMVPLYVLYEISIIGVSIFIHGTTTTTTETAPLN